jgi:hypothetical protein
MRDHNYKTWDSVLVKTLDEEAAPPFPPSLARALASGKNPRIEQSCPDRIRSARSIWPASLLSVRAVAGIGLRSLGSGGEEGKAAAAAMADDEHLEKEETSEVSGYT